MSFGLALIMTVNKKSVDSVSPMKLAWDPTYKCFKFFKKNERPRKKERSHDDNRE